MQDPETIRQIANYGALGHDARRYKKHSSSSDSGDGELLGALILFTGYAAYQGAKFVGKAAIEGGKVAVKGSKIAGKTAANAYKLHKGYIEIVDRDKDGNIIEKAPEPPPIEPQEDTTFYKREKVKEWIGKGAKRSKSARFCEGKLKMQ